MAAAASRGEGYYFTDLAKCTVPTGLAKKTPRRYELCSGYFARELASLTPRLIIAAGLDAYRNLKLQKRPGWPVIFSVLHYSAANRAWHAKVAERAAAKHRARVASLAEFVEFIESRRRAYGHGRRSSKKPPRQHLALLTAYSVQFAAIQTMLATGSLATDRRVMVHVSP